MADIEADLYGDVDNDEDLEAELLALEGKNPSPKRKPKGKLLILFQTQIRQVFGDNLGIIFYTGDSRYVDITYLDTITYVEVIFHSQPLFSVFLCISTSMSKTVNMKQRVSRGDFFMS